MNCHKSLSSEGTVNFTLSDLRFLKVQLLKRLYIQVYLGKHTKADISSEMARVTEGRAIEAKALTLEWKYRNMTVRRFGFLQFWAQKYAAKEVRQYTCSRSFVEKFHLILDANEDTIVDKTEFIDFFNLEKSEFIFRFYVFLFPMAVQYIQYITTSRCMYSASNLYIECLYISIDGEHLERIHSLLYQPNELTGSSGVNPSG